jgi:hypothetical protein
MLHIPILRHGAPYSSVDKQRVPHYRTRETFVEISQANAGLIRRDGAMIRLTKLGSQQAKSLFG